MINHARTLLLNLSSGVIGAPEFPGEEIIPTQFAPLQLPLSLKYIYSILFNNVNDRLTFNILAANYMAILHSVPLTRGWVQSLDKRITYTAGEYENYQQFAANNTIYSLQNQTIIIPYNNATQTIQVLLQNGISAPGMGVYMVNFNGSDAVTIIDAHNYQVYDYNVLSYNDALNTTFVTSSFSIPNNPGSSATISGTSAQLNSPCGWKVITYNKNIPNFSLAAIMSNFTKQNTDFLFTNKENDPVLMSIYNMYSSSYILLEQFAAILAAYIYNVNEI